MGRKKKKIDLIPKVGKTKQSSVRMPAEAWASLEQLAVQQNEGRDLILQQPFTSSKLVYVAVRDLLRAHDLPHGFPDPA